MENCTRMLARNLQLVFLAALVVAMLTPVPGFCETVVLEVPGDAPPAYPNSAYRFRDIAQNPYAPSYQDGYTYDDASVTLSFQESGESSFTGHISATNLKPNFAYQLKLEGKPTGVYGAEGDDLTNEYLGFAGRWWRKLPTEGPADDAQYIANHDLPGYAYLGYLLFDFFVTDQFGNIEFDFELDSSYHVLRASWEGYTPGPCDLPIWSASVVGQAGDLAYKDDYGPTSVDVIPQIERNCYGTTDLPQDHVYNCRFFLTEESFHHFGSAAVPGWASASGKQFQRDGGDYYYAGTNCYYLMVYAGDLGLRHYVDEVLEDAKAMGLGVVRTWAFNDGADEWQALQTSPGVYDESVFVGLDYVLHKARQLGLQLILPFVNWNPDYGGMDQYLEWAGYSAPYDRDDFYVDTDCRAWYKDHVNAVLNRVNTFNGLTYKNDPTVFAWELANEPHGNSSLVNAWIVEMSDYIESLDSNHLVTTGIYGYKWGHSTSTWVADHQVANIDFATFHFYADYHGMAGNLPGSEAVVQGHIDLADTQILKPVIFEEFNRYRPLTGANGRDAFLQAYYDVVYDNAQAGTASAGSNFWILYHDDYPDYDSMGVYYPGDASTVAIIESEARRIRDLSSSAPQEGNYAAALTKDISFALGVDASITPVAAGSAPIPCGGSREVSFHYVQDAEEIRGYSVRVQCTGELGFDGADVTVHPQPGTLNPDDYAYQIFQEPGAGANDWSIDYVILGDLNPGEGIPSGVDLFTIEFDGASEGTGTVSMPSATLGSLAGPPVTVNYVATAEIEVDCTGPAAASGLSAVPGLDKVALSWTDPGDDEVEIEVWRALWYDADYGVTTSAYPEYDDLANDAVPEAPADYAGIGPEWALAGTVAAGTQGFVDDPVPHGRGIYYYVLFARDEAGNMSPTSAMDRATSYLLGDVPPYDNGDVDLNDIGKLGASYGLLDGPPPYNAECDVGPTDDNSGWGIPETDDYVGFEDLMIFAQNYNELVTKGLSPSGSPVALLSWSQVAEDIWSLSLVEACADLQGLRLSAELPAGAVSAVEAGELLEAQGVPYFLHNIDAHGLDLGLALLGRGATIRGSGELCRVILGAERNPSLMDVTLRSSSNGPVEYEIVTEGPQIPARYRLATNYPNPFNPATSIRFDLPATQAVKLMIYSVTGQPIATLVDGSMPAGRHEVTWLGRTDDGARAASGIYIYRIEAGPFTKSGKMTLLK